MLSKRIIAALDVKNGRTVKGVQFKELVDAGDPVELAYRYSEEGADEIVLLDIRATEEGRGTMLEVVQGIAQVLSIPCTVGGGVRNQKDVSQLLSAGADKIFLNSAFLAVPDLIDKLVKEFGSQCIVAAIDARHEAGQWTVYSSGGKVRTSRELFAWAREVSERGVGEILFTSMNHDGTQNGFACEVTGQLSRNLPIQVIASGGAGTERHFLDVFNAGADAALAASVFHYRKLSFSSLKKFLSDRGVEVRI